MLRSFDMNLLIVFHTLIEEGSVTRTGDRLGRTQSAISNSLRRLREAFDDPLFVRSSEGLVPTPRALALADEVAGIIRAAENCLASEAEIDPATTEAQFVIGAPDRLSLPVFLPFMKHMAQIAPRMRIDLRTADRAVAIQLIEEEQIDVALGWFDDLPPHIHRSVAFSEDLVCLCRHDHPIAQGTPDMETILSYPQLMVSSGGGRAAAFDTILTKQGYRREIQTALTNFTLVPHLLADSDMVGIFTRRTAEYFASAPHLITRAVPLEFAPISHELAWHRRFDTDPKHVWLREQIVAACE